MNITTVTLLVSTYNWEDALRLCLLSALDQTVPPNEIVVADDGSLENTRKLIEEMRTITNIPIIHVWHEDKGFRLTTIRNKAIAHAMGEYIIQIDGDVILEKHFIQDHIELMQKGYFVCGSRVKLAPNVTAKLIKDVCVKLSIFNLKTGFVLNSIRSKTLRSFMAKRYARRINHMRGCNMAFWKTDLILINGYNEDLQDWGQEDAELVYRLHFAGVKKNH